MRMLTVHEHDLWRAIIGEGRKWMVENPDWFSLVEDWEADGAEYSFVLLANRIIARLKEAS